jgi:glycosyltransferase involved in cell wall biosynthesis
MDPLPLVSVIVPVYRMDRQVSRLLACLDAQIYPMERFECVIVDNHPNPVLQQLGSHPFRLKVVHEPRPGSYAARNGGVAEAIGEVLAFTDADCQPQPCWLQQAVRTWQEHAGEVIVGGRVSIKPDEPAERNGWCWYSMVNDLLQDLYVHSYGFAATANLVVSAEIFARVAGFNASLYSGGDLEWCQRAGRLGIPLVYADAAVVDHPPRTQGWETIRRMRRLVGGQYRLSVLTYKHPWLSLIGSQWTLGVLCLQRNLRTPLYPCLPIRLQALAIALMLRLVILMELLRLASGGVPVRD